MTPTLWLIGFLLHVLALACIALSFRSNRRAAADLRKGQEALACNVRLLSAALEQQQRVNVAQHAINAAQHQRCDLLTGALARALSGDAEGPALPPIH